WKRSMIEATAPKLPDNPTPAQLDAWIELAEIVSDPAFIENLRENAKDVWGKFDIEAMRRAADEVAAAAKGALSRSVPPQSEEAKHIVERYGAALAAAKGGAFDHLMRQGMRERFARHDPRAARYWELVAIMNSKPSMAIKVDEWNWVKAAVLHHFSR